MMNGHPQYDEAFDLYALGALDAQERGEMESHVKQCRDCAEKLAAARQRIAVVALSVPEVRPPEQIKKRLMERVHTESQPAAAGARRRHDDSPAAVASTQGARFAFLRRPSLAWSFAACAAVLAVVFAVRSSHLQQQLNQQQQQIASLQNSAAHDRLVSGLLTGNDTQRVLLTEAQSASHPEGRVYYHPSRGLLFYANNLPAVPPGRAYELWVIPTQGAPIPAGTFQPNGRGEGSVILPALPPGVTAKAFAVTLEPAGGVPSPTGPKVLVGAPA